MHPITDRDETFNKCSEIVFKTADTNLWHIPGYSAYSFGQDCYAQDYTVESGNTLASRQFLNRVLAKQEEAINGEKPLISDGINRFVDQSVSYTISL